MKVLVTCPPMIGQIDRFKAKFEEVGFDITVPEIVQCLTEDELVELLPAFDGWIIGDDPANEPVLAAGAAGRLKAAVKWGIGVDNVDFDAARNFGIKIINTPGMFGAEVADLALHYVTGLLRSTYLIDRGVRSGDWPKPTGCSLAGKTVALVGYGDIGRNFARRAVAADMKVVVYDPVLASDEECAPFHLQRWPENLADGDLVVLTCALTESSRQMVNSETLAQMKPGVMLINVARGGLVDEAALIEALDAGHVRSAALDVFEVEPLPASSLLRQFPHCIFGTHNGSNTVEAVERATIQAIDRLAEFLGG